MLDLLYAYEKYLYDVKHASDNTVSSYIRDLKQFAEWLQSQKCIELHSASEADICAYLVFLQENGKSGATVSRTLASLRNFYAYAAENGIVEFSPVVSNIRIERGEKHVPQILTEDEISALLDQPVCHDFKGMRDKAMLELMYATGMRVSELINLNVEDVLTEIGMVHCGEKKNARTVPVYPEAMRILKEYINDQRNPLINGAGENALFVNIAGKRISRQGFWKVLKTYQVKAGIEKEIAPHTLRHSFAVHLLQNGADIDSLQQLMGHSDISSTQLYAHMISGKLRSVYDSSHPRSSKKKS